MRMRAQFMSGNTMGYSTLFQTIAITAIIIVLRTPSVAAWR